MRNILIWLFFALALILLPHALSFSQQEILVFLVINVLLVVSYRLLTLTGEWSLGHVVVMGVGAYTSALLTKRLGVYVPVSMIMGALMAGFIAFLLSFPLFRMKGFYFLIGSFASAEIIRLLWKRFREPFGGPKGLKRIDPMPDIDLGFIQIDFFEPVVYYYFALIVVAICLWVAVADRALADRADLSRGALAGQARAGRGGWMCAATARWPLFWPRALPGSPGGCWRIMSARSIPIPLMSR